MYGSKELMGILTSSNAIPHPNKCKSAADVSPTQFHAYDPSTTLLLAVVSRIDGYQQDEKCEGDLVNMSCRLFNRYHQTYQKYSQSNSIDLPTSSMYFPS